MTEKDIPQESPDDPGDDQKPPAELSVDQLTQAFAQLIGQDTSASSTDPSTGAENAASEEQGLAEPEEVEAEEDDSSVSAEAILEAILFVGHPSNEPLTSRLMAGYLRGVTPAEVDELLAKLNQSYEESNAPYQVVSEGPGYRLTLRTEHEGLRERFYGRVREAKLSQLAIDLLAIVAYHQPIDRQSIDKLIGRPCGAMLSQLVRRELLKIERTKEKPKKTLYSTDDRFLDLFQLESLDDLPRHDDFHYA